MRYDRLKKASPRGGRVKSRLTTTRAGASATRVCDEVITVVNKKFRLCPELKAVWKIKFLSSSSRQTFETISKYVFKLKLIKQLVILTKWL